MYYAVALEIQEIKIYSYSFAQEATQKNMLIYITFAIKKMNTKAAINLPKIRKSSNSKITHRCRITWLAGMNTNLYKHFGKHT